MRGKVVRVGLVLLELVGLQVGGWASVAPRSFYDDFPGGGRTWVAADGPYNEHLVRDFGALNLALAAVVAVALVTWVPAVVRTAGLAWLVYSVPHLVYHVRHLHVYDTSDQVLNMVALGGAVVTAAVVLAIGTGGTGETGGTAGTGDSGDPGRPGSTGGSDDPGDPGGPGGPGGPRVADDDQPRNSAPST